MPKSLLLVVAGAVGAAVVASLFAAPRSPEPEMRGTASTVHTPRSAQEAPATRVAQPSAAPGVPAAPPQRSLEDAMRDLDLIRPSREKLAQDFSLETTDNSTFRLSAHRGKVVFVNFWATWCPPCTEEMPAMDRLYRKYRDRGLVMVAVSVDADPAVVTPFIREHKLSFTVALDPKMEAANAYAVRALPSSFIVDTRGTMAALALGPRVWDGAPAAALIEGLLR